FHGSIFMNWEKKTRSSYACYMKLFAYEVINGIGISSPEDGLSHLMHMWDAYKEIMMEKLDFLPGMIMEYMFINGYPEGRLADFFRNAMVELIKHEKLENLIPLIEILLSVRETPSLIGLPLKVYYLLSGYSKLTVYRKSKYKKEIDEHAKIIMPIVEKMIWRKIHDIDVENSLFKHYSRLAFPEARYFNKPDRITLVKLSPAITRQIMHYGKMIKQLLRFIQNRVRDLHDVRSKLKIGEIDREMIAIVDYHFMEHGGLPGVTPGVSKYALDLKTGNFKIDEGRVHALEKDSNKLKEKLLTAGEQVIDEMPPTSENGELTEVDSADHDTTGDDSIIGDLGKFDFFKHHSFGENSPIKGEHGTNQDDDEWGTFIKKLTPLQLEYLQLLISKGPGSPELLYITTEHAIMPEMVIEGINEISMDVIGDVIIEGGEIIEFYIEELEGRMKGDGDDYTI
ncbi:hypothetical protein GF325_12240, partial [Candidatus Bathyarchaeota archaeon]|nr:hypothetical protein [Candidatus Bathyarchaeota archaeon]